MRIRFQRRPIDIYLLLAHTAGVIGLMLALNIGNLFALLLVLFSPGYVLVAALFPTDEELEWIERIALSVGMSIAVVPLLGLILNFTPFGIRFVPVMMSLAIFTALVGFAAIWRRAQLPAEKRLQASINLSLGWWKDSSLFDRWLSIALVASVALAGSTMAYVFLSPPLRTSFTEFYVLGPGGNASDYPTNLSVSEPGTVILGVVNHEADVVDYTVGVELAGVRILFNSTSGRNETVESNRTPLASFNLSLQDGRNWSVAYTFTINFVGLWKVLFSLYKNSVATSQQLHLLVRVS